MADNTIAGFRKVQWGAELGGTIAATGTLTVVTQPTAGDTMTIGTTLYTFVADGTADADGEINVGTNLTTAQLNIANAIKGIDGINTPHPTVRASGFLSNISTLTAKVGGTGGNTIATTETFTAVGNVFGAATLGGGAATGGIGRGTAVAATSIVAVEEMAWDDADENIYRPKVANGILIRNRGRGTPVEHGTRFTLTDQPFVWEQAMHWLAMSIRGDVEPTGTGAEGDPFVWVFERGPTVNPNPLSFTLEREYANGLGDVVDQRASYCLLGSLGLKFAAREHLRMSGAGFARKFNTSPATPSLTLPDFEIGVSALSTVYVDDDWADVGTTLLTEEVIGWDLTIGTGFGPLFTAEGRPTLDFTKHRVNGNEVTLGCKLTILLDPDRYTLEQAAAQAGLPRAFRVHVDGTGDRALDIDMFLQHSKPSLFKIGEFEGQDMIELDLEEGTDGSNFLRVTLTHPDVGDFT